jgi:DNA replicative helicase MCM subunit Mcm2 (Cdc46/Mcm family)
MELMIDTDKLVSVKGLVIRATPVIPDMSMGGFLHSPAIKN